MSILSWLDEEDWGVVSVVSILFGLSLTRSDTKVSDTVAIRAIRLVGDVSPSPTATGDPTRGRGVEGLPGVERSLE